MLDSGTGPAAPQRELRVDPWATVAREPMDDERCSWCGAPIAGDDGFRVTEPAGARRAAFCRLEHIVPWAIQGAYWEAVPEDEPAPDAAEAGACSHCEAPLPDTRVRVVRHRGEHRIADGFCSVDHLLAWAKAGGRWR